MIHLQVFEKSRVSLLVFNSSGGESHSLGGEVGEKSVRGGFLEVGVHNSSAHTHLEEG